MKPVLNRWPRRGSLRFNDLTVQRFHLTAIFLGLVFSVATARSQTPPATTIARSLSGQFTITAGQTVSPLFRLPGLATNCLRLDPPLLAVAAENFKDSLWRQIGLKASVPWAGKIFFELHPARSTAEEVTIASGVFVKVWDYHVAMPDVVTRPRYARAMASVLLLEIANRQNQNPFRSVEIPQWLAAGLAQQVLATDAKAALTMPARSSGGILLTRIDEAQTMIDPFAGARNALDNYPTLTFDELSWPTGAQLDGEDGGAYLACAQLFTASLLGLKDGPQNMRAFLARLPDYLNWQTAFFAAFQSDFKRPLDVEKWWALRVVNFTAHAPGPHWNTDESRARFEDLLAVPVEYRYTTNALPQAMAVTLQTAIRSFSSADRDTVVRMKLRDFGIAQFRLAAPFDSLAAGYRAVLADYLGEQGGSRTVIRDKHGQPVRHFAGVEATLAKLDALDARRRAFEVKLNAIPTGKILIGRQN